MRIKQTIMKYGDLRLYISLSSDNPIKNFSKAIEFDFTSFIGFEIVKFDTNKKFIGDSILVSYFDKSLMSNFFKETLSYINSQEDLISIKLIDDIETPYISENVKKTFSFKSISGSTMILRLVIIALEDDYELGFKIFINKKELFYVISLEKFQAFIENFCEADLFMYSHQMFQSYKVGTLNRYQTINQQVVES